jgi:GNAT superfamily N-acetyltransferase
MGVDVLHESGSVELRQGNSLISTDKSRLDTDLICDYLSGSSYWARGRPHDVIMRSIENSLCFGLYDNGRQIGFARVVTDYATFAWLADVFVVTEYRGRGLGKWLMKSVVSHPEVRNLKQVMLATRDAQGFYRRYGGFEVIPTPGRFMLRSTVQRGSPERPEEM